MSCNDEIKDCNNGMIVCNDKVVELQKTFVIARSFSLTTIPFLARIV
ncbi:MAG: hypothetical protein J1E31_06275 [Helicobacter sp.]|nr:hypothetical protein [Helicobacter sp.]